MNTKSLDSTHVTLADGWYLEGYDDAQKTWLVRIDRFPFIVGRRDDCDLCIQAPEVSREHARIERGEQETLIVHDQSVNGTFVNSERIAEPKIVGHNDILRFSKKEFRLLFKDSKKNAPLLPEAANNEREFVTRVSHATSAEVASGFFSEERRFEKLLSARAVKPYFQPLIRCVRSGPRWSLELHGFELLGRGALEGLPESPVALFKIAERTRQAIALSALFCAQLGYGRRELVEAAANQLETLPFATNWGWALRRASWVRQSKSSAQYRAVSRR